ncbi:MAG: hypothetical protein GY811_00165 [Myxococcales bacterium]|nr:hypothetical protein [Myxococcales bacterium]
MRHVAQQAIAVFVSASLWGACSSSSTSGTSSKPTPTQPTPKASPDLTIFLTAEMKGSTEPCGCTSDPLGDLARTSELIKRARAAGPVLVLDGGSTLYTQVHLTDNTRAQEVLKSQLIETAFRDDLLVSAMGLGPYDFGQGADKVSPPRHAVNLAEGSGVALQAPEIIDAGGMKVGVFGVLSPDALSSFNISATDPAEAATKAITDLKARGAQVTIALAHMGKDEARDLAKTVEGMDFVLISQNLPKPNRVRSEPMRVRDTWLFMPANRGQVISRLRLNRRTNGAFADALGEVRAAEDAERLVVELSDLKASIEKWSNEPGADAAFIAKKRAEAVTTAQEIAELRKSPLRPPSDGNYFTLAQLKIHKGLDCQTNLVEAKRAYDRESGLANVKAAVGKKPVAVPKGEASYVGSEICEMCHEEAFEFWQGTMHAKAWETLEGLGKEFDFDCIGCHVTGFEKPGGSNIAFNDTLRDVQCEQCHGPGSAHSDSKKGDKRAMMARSPEASVCAQCHTKKHSDTFEYKAYLRDITGPGHGADFRTELGEGATGESLRAEAREKASVSIGQNCPK